MSFCFLSLFSCLLAQRFSLSRRKGRKTSRNAPALPGVTATVVVAGPPKRKPLRDTAAPADAAAPDPFPPFFLALPAPPAAVETVEAPALVAPPAAAPGAAPAAVEDCPAAELPVAVFPFVAALLVEVEPPPPLPINPPPPPLPRNPPPPPPPPAAAAPAAASLLMASRAPLASRERLEEEEEEEEETAASVVAATTMKRAVAAKAAVATKTAATASVSEARALPRPPLVVDLFVRAISLISQPREKERKRLKSEKDGAPCRRAQGAESGGERVRAEA